MIEKRKKPKESGKRYIFPVSCTYPRSLRTTLTFGADYDLAAK